MKHLPRFQEFDSKKESIFRMDEPIKSNLIKIVSGSILICKMLPRKIGKNIDGKFDGKKNWLLENMKQFFPAYRVQKKQKTFNLFP